MIFLALIGWMMLAPFLALAFIADVLVELWRKGGEDQARRRAQR